VKKVSIFLIIVIALSLSANVFAQSEFKDIGSHWAKDYIQKLTGMGAIKGKGDGLFHPGDTITRAEFTAILLRSLGDDVGQPDSGMWYMLYMQEAENKGYIKAGEFQNVEQNITRLEIAKMITRALDKEQLAAELQDKHTGFKDDYAVAMDYKGYVIILKEYGIINGTPEGYFLPDRSADRAEATKMIVTFLENRDIDLAIEPDSYAQGEDDTLIIDGKEVVIENTEMYNAIKKCENILNSGGILEYHYSAAYGKIQFYFYTSEKAREIGESLWFEVNLNSSLTYSLTIQNIHDDVLLTKYKTLIHSIFPDLEEFTFDLINKKIQNGAYKIKYMDTAGAKKRHLNLFLFEDYPNSFDMYISVEGGLLK